jgi:uncharacterized protein with HEPN domain
MTRDRSYLVHARDAIEWVLRHTAEGREAFFAERKTQDAVLRNLEILGEAVKQVSGNLKAAHPEIPWRQIAGLRDKLIHEYFGVDLELIWKVVEDDLPHLRERVERLLLEAEGEEE